MRNKDQPLSEDDTDVTQTMVKKKTLEEVDAKIAKTYVNFAPCCH